MKTLKFLWLLMLLSAWSIAGAVNILTGETVTIRDRQPGNVYIGASTVAVEAPVDGNLTCGGGEVRILDTLGRDLTVGGGKIEVRGPVLGDVRCAGGQLYLYSTVNGDVVAAGGELEIGRDAVIEGDLVVAGGTVRVYGRILGAVVLAGGELRFAGIAEREIELRGGKVFVDGTVNGPAIVSAEAIELGSAARFMGPVRYWQQAGELNFAPYLRGSEAATFDASLRTDTRQWQADWFRWGFTYFFIFRLLAASLVIALLVALFRPFFERIGGPLRENWLAKFGTGILYFIGVPLAIVMVLVTVIGIPVALFALFLYIFSLVFAHALTAVIAAFAWERYRGYTWTKGQVILAAIGIFVLLKLISWIPFIGLLLSLVAVGIAFGSILQALVRRPVVPVSGA
jgi:cytoskeletal protein CcmA (bactofilin family)